MISFSNESKARKAAIVLSCEYAAAWVVPLPSGKYSVGYDDAGELPENSLYRWAYQNGEQVSK